MTCHTSVSSSESRDVLMTCHTSVSSHHTSITRLSFIRRVMDESNEMHNLRNLFLLSLNQSELVTVNTCVVRIFFLHVRNFFINFINFINKHESKYSEIY